VVLVVPEEDLLVDDLLELVLGDVPAAFLVVVDDDEAVATPVVTTTNALNDEGVWSFM